jgi:xanthine dehydrogenase large subunit
VPDVYFMPDNMEVRLLDRADNPHGPLGSKAVGEPPLMYGIGLFFAVRDAMRAYRPDCHPVFDAPMTPERVLLQLHPEQAAILERHGLAPIVHE